MTEQVQTTCKRERRIRDIKIIATFPGDDRRYHWETWEKYEIRLRNRASYFQNFLRDHRSQDKVNLDIEVEHEEVCTHCECQWEPYHDDDGVLCCAGCGAIIVEGES